MNIAILTSSEVQRDPRIQRAANLFLTLGNNVCVYNIWRENFSKWPDDYPFDIVTLKQKSYSGKFFESSLSDLNKFLPEIENILFDTIEKSEIDNTLRAFRLKGPLKKHLPLKYIRMIRKLVIPIKKCSASSSSSSSVSTYSFSRKDEVYSIISNLLHNFYIAEESDKWGDIIYANDLDTLLAGVLLKLKYNKILIYDAHEIWPKQWASGVHSKQFEDFYSALEKELLKYTDFRITVGQGLKKYFESEYQSEPFEVIYNVPSSNNLIDEKILDRKVSNPLKALYHGVYLPFRGLEELIEVAPMMNNSEFFFSGDWCS